MLNHAIHPLPLLCVAVRAVGSGRGRRGGRRAGGRCWGRGYLRARGTGLVAAVEPRRFVEAGIVARLDAPDDKSQPRSPSIGPRVNCVMSDATAYFAVALRSDMGSPDCVA